MSEHSQEQREKDARTLQRAMLLLARLWTYQPEEREVIQEVRSGLRELLEALEKAK